MTEQLTGVTSDGRTDTETDTNETWLKIGGVPVTLASVMESLVGYGLLPAKMRIHWSLGGPYYGPEFAQSWMILALFPLVVGSVGVGFYWLRTRVWTDEEVADERPVFTLAAVGTMVVLVAIQTFLVVMNL